MSIYGVSSSLPNIGRPPLQRPLRDGARGPAQDSNTVGRPQTQQPATAPQALAPAQHSVPVEPPAGTDPALWSVLSSDERAFFAKAGAMGPLTYGRAFEDMRATQLPASRGGRLDVKV